MCVYTYSHTLAAPLHKRTPKRGTHDQNPERETPNLEPLHGEFSKLTSPFRSPIWYGTLIKTRTLKLGPKSEDDPHPKAFYQSHLILFGLKVEGLQGAPGSRVWGLECITLRVHVPK